MTVGTSDFTGREGVVTGAGSGIGRQIALDLAAAGAVVVAVDVNASSLDDTVTAAGKGRMLPFACDVSHAAAAHDAMALASAHGTVTVLALAAAVIDRHSFLEADDDIWHRTLDVNVIANAAFVRAASTHMRAVQDGRIVLIASVNGHIGSPLVPYSVSKSAIHGLVRSAAPVLAPQGIRINSISPGVIATNMNSARLSDEPARRREIEGIPLGRLGRPTDIADAALFLLGDSAGYITGADLVIDGGFSFAKPGRPDRTAGSH